MSALTPFNNRTRWCNPDGTLTPEALRLLEILRDRAGGTLGDVGVDVFAPTDVSARADASAVMQPIPAADPLPEIVMQPVLGDRIPADIVQPTLDYSAGTGLALASLQFSLKDTLVTPGTYGNASNVAQFTVDQQGRITGVTNVAITFPGGANFTGSFTGKTVTVTNGIITSVV
jgi:hypothetical protein